MRFVPVWIPAYVFVSLLALPIGRAQSAGLRTAESTGVPAPGCNEYSMQTITNSEKIKAFGIQQRACYWRNQLVTPNAVFGAVFFGAIAQARDSPVEWPQGADGFGRRVGTRYTQGMIKSTATFLVSYASGEDPRPKPPQVYDYSESLNGRTLMRFGCRQATTFKGRLGQSMLRTVWDRCQETVLKQAKPGRLAGSFASGFAGLTWSPPSTNHISNALTDSGTAFGGYVADSVFSEFSPDISRLFAHLFPMGKIKERKP